MVCDKGVGFFPVQTAEKTHFSSADSKLSISAMTLSISIFNFWTEHIKKKVFSSCEHKDTYVVMSDYVHVTAASITWISSRRSFLYVLMLSISIFSFDVKSKDTAKHQIKADC